MSDYLEDTPTFGRSYCPGCEPDADPIKEILDTRHCAIHSVSLSGLDDSGVVSEGYMSGSAEAGGNDNARWCDIIHRKKHDASTTTPV